MKNIKYLICTVFILLLCGCSCTQTNVFQGKEEKSSSLETVHHPSDLEETTTLLDMIPREPSDFPNEKYGALVCDYSDSIAGVIPEIEFDKWNGGGYQDPTASSEISRVWNGETVLGIYQDSMVQSTNDYTTHRYLDQNQRPFAVDSETGKVVSYFWGTSTQDYTVILDEDDCLKIAKDFMSGMVDISNYTISSEKGDGRYTVNFRKFVHGIKTADCATVVVLEDGSLYSFSSFMLGKMTADNVIPFDMNETDLAVAEKMNTLYAKAMETYDDVVFSVRSRVYTTVNDFPAIQYYVDIDCVNIMGEFEEHIGGVIELVVLERVLPCP